MLNVSNSWIYSLKSWCQQLGIGFFYSKISSPRSKDAGSAALAIGCTVIKLGEKAKPLWRLQEPSHINKPTSATFDGTIHMNPKGYHGRNPFLQHGPSIETSLECVFLNTFNRNESISCFWGNYQNNIIWLWHVLGDYPSICLEFWFSYLLSDKSQNDIVFWGYVRFLSSLRAISSPEKNQDLWFRKLVFNRPKINDDLCFRRIIWGFHIRKSQNWFSIGLKAMIIYVFGALFEDITLENHKN